MSIDGISTCVLRSTLLLRAVVGAIALFVLSMGVASAAGRANAGITETVTSARWGTVFVLQGQSATSGPLLIDWTNVKKNPYQFIDLVNTSSVPLVGETISTSTIRNGSGNQSLPTITFALCRGGTFDAVTGVCSATTVDLGAGTSGSLSLTEPLAVNGRLSLRASTSAGTGSPFTTTFSTAVARSQVPVAKVVNG